MLKALLDLFLPTPLSVHLDIIDANVKERLLRERYQREIERLEAKARAEMTQALAEIRAHRAATEL